MGNVEIKDIKSLGTVSVDTNIDVKKLTKLQKGWIEMHLGSGSLDNRKTVRYVSYVK